MNTPAPTPAPAPILAAIPWYQSHVVIAQVSSALTGLIALSPHLGWVKALGLNDPQTVENTVTSVFGGVAVLAQLWALITRARSSIQPVTLTQMGASLHPNTLAVEQAHRNDVAASTGPPKS